MPKIDSKPFTYVTPLRWSNKVTELADTPAAALLDDNAGLSFAWVSKQNVLVGRSSTHSLKNSQQANILPVHQDLAYIDYWEHEGTDEITLIQIIIAAKNILQAIHRPISNIDTTHNSYLGDITVGEVAYLIARNRRSILSMGFLSIDAWRNVTKRLRPVTEPYSVLAWINDHQGFPSDNYVSKYFTPNPLSWTTQYKTPFGEFIIEAHTTGLQFDDMLRYRDSNIPYHLILPFHQQGIDPELAASLTEVA